MNSWITCSRSAEGRPISAAFDPCRWLKLTRAPNRFESGSSVGATRNRTQAYWIDRCITKSGNRRSAKGECLVGENYGDGQCNRRIEPIPAAHTQDDRPGGCYASCRGGVGDGVEQDGCDREVALSGLGAICSL